MTLYCVDIKAFSREFNSLKNKKQYKIVKSEQLNNLKQKMLGFSHLLSNTLNGITHIEFDVDCSTQTS